MLTLDEASELQEHLIGACDAAIARGMRIVPLEDSGPGCLCPLAAMLWAELGGSRYPASRTAHDHGVPLVVADGVISGFDGDDAVMLGGDPLAFEVGRRLRERYWREGE